MKNDTLNKILVAIIGVLAVIILTGTIVGVRAKKQQTPEVLIAQGKAVNLAEPASTDVLDYYDLGKIRILTAPDPKIQDDTGTVIILKPWLSYPKGDTVLYEELSRKRGVIKGLFSSYFSGRTKKALLSTTEEAITKDLETLINAELSLGKIQGIYFTDYLFLE